MHETRLVLPTILVVAAFAFDCSGSWAKPPPAVADNSNRIAPAVVDAPAPDTLPSLDQQAALRDSLSAIGRQLPGHTMLDEEGRPVSLSGFRGKPLLVNFIYTGCYRICPNTTRVLRKAVNAMRDRFGDDQFNVVSIGFDQPTDSPMALREFAARQSIRDANWVFLSPAKADVAAVARSFGFSFMPTPMGFDHTLQVSVVDSAGFIRQQVLGDAFGPDSLGEPLKRLLGGTLVEETRSLSDLFARLRILCSVYDAETGRYRVDYSLYIEIAGGTTFIFLMAWLAIREWRDHRARMRLQRA
jgi:protein SCO1/2